MSGPTGPTGPTWGSLDGGMGRATSLGKEIAVALIKPEITVEAVEVPGSMTVSGQDGRYISVMLTTPNVDVEVMIDGVVAAGFAHALLELAELIKTAPPSVRALTVIPPAKATEVYNGPSQRRGDFWTYLG